VVSRILVGSKLLIVDVRVLVRVGIVISIAGG